MPELKVLEQFKLTKVMNSPIQPTINDTDFCDRLATCKEEHQLMVDGVAHREAHEFYLQIGQFCKPCREHFEDLTTLKSMVQKNIQYIEPPEKLTQHIADLIRKST
jgi:hypothetical protein